MYDRLPAAIASMFLLLAALGVSAQHTAPLTHDRHTHQPNPAHPTVEATDQRFNSPREGRALALPTEDEAFTFAIFGDRTGGPNQGINVLAQAVADVNLLEPDLVMTVGDLINGYNQTAGWMEQMTQYHQVMDELLCPWFPVAGNHDTYWRGDNRPENEHEDHYEEHFGPLWYAFDHKGCTFIVLYTDEGDPQTGERNFRNPNAQRMSDAQFNWLSETLEAAADSSHVFLFLHHPRWLGTRAGRVGYGDDWERVHDLLVEAGNVSGVFAGHIHHMRHDPDDGINYFTLATVGGGQPGWSPEAGWLHHFNLVTVRENQVAFSALPVGGVMDPRAITGDVSEQSEVLGRSMPVRFGEPVAISENGSVDHELTVTVNNPAEFAIEVELVLTSDDSRWSFSPDHAHATIQPGASTEITYRVTRPVGVLDATARPVTAVLNIDMLTDRLRFAIPAKRFTVPGSLVIRGN